MKIALDAMGHDDGPRKLVEGAALALNEFPQIGKLFLTGDTPQLEAELARVGCNDRRIEIAHCTQVVEMTDHAADAVRRKRDSSIARAVDLVKEGEAEAVVSAGHTGACVAATSIKLRTLPGIERPAIAATMPTERGLFVLIDAGANTAPTPLQMVHNAIMGSVYSQYALGIGQPEVGLMSVGTEEEKGTDFTRETLELLKAISQSGAQNGAQSSQPDAALSAKAPYPLLRLRGNVEGHDLFANPVDVVVTDGFTGNIILKTSEALAKSIFRMLKAELLANPVRKLGTLLAKGAFMAIRERTSADRYGGMPLLGVNGVCIIGHGGSSPVAVKNAIRMAIQSISTQVNPHIVEQIQRYNSQTAA